MSVTDYKYPGTVTMGNDGMKDWNNPDYIKADDTSYADVKLTKYAQTEFLYITNFSFGIPTGSTIDGYEFIINRRGQFTGATGCADSQLYVYYNGSVGSNLGSATTWPGTLTDATYGGSADLCGASFTLDNVNSSSFGLKFQATSRYDGNCNAYVDYVKMRVYYTEGSGATVKPHYYYLQQ